MTATTIPNARIAILAEDLYEENELWYPYYRLKEAGAAVTLVGTGRSETFKSKHGVPVVPERTTDDISVSDFDAVVIPGGYSPDMMRRKASLVAFVREMHEAGKTVAAICHAPWVLVSAGILDGKQVTSFGSIKDDVEAAGGTYLDEAVVVDGNLVTSRAPADLPAFVPAIIENIRARSADRTEELVAN